MVVESTRYSATDPSSLFRAPEKVSVHLSQATCEYGWNLMRILILVILV